MEVVENSSYVCSMPPDSVRTVPLPLNSKLPSSMCQGLLLFFFLPVTSPFVSSIKVKHFLPLGMS